MPRFLSVLALALTTFAQVHAKDDNAKTDPTGSWRWTNAQTAEEDLLRLQLKSKGKVIGAYHPSEGDSSYAIKEGRMEGDKFSCQLKIEVDGSEVDVRVEARIKGDQLEGDVHYEDAAGDVGHIDWTARRSVQVDDALGAWQLQFTSPDGVEHDPVMHVERKGEGVAVKLTGGNGDMTAESARFAKGELVAKFRFKYEGQPIAVTYHARPRGYEIGGVIEFELNGDEGEFEFEGERKQSS